MSRVRVPGSRQSSSHESVLFQVSRRDNLQRDKAGRDRVAGAFAAALMMAVSPISLAVAQEKPNTATLPPVGAPETPPASPASPPNAAVQPTAPVSPTIQGIAAGRDEALDQALSLVGAPKP